MELNEKLISLRKQNKLTQAQVAETLDVSRQAISNWETGAVLPSTDNLKALSRLYQVPADSLLNDDTDLFAGSVEKTAENNNTNSKFSILKKRRAIILIYLLTIFLVVALSVAATLFVLWAREPKAIDLYDLESEQVSFSDIEVDDFL
jgi:XRE family transcriptional regulator